MSADNNFCLRVIISGHLLALALFSFLLWAVMTDRLAPHLPEKVPEIEDVWFGAGTQPRNEDISIKPFKIKISEPELQDFRTRLESGVKRMQMEPAPMEDSFEYGINSKYLTNTLAFHWLKSYDWRQTEKRLNAMGSHFKTNVQGIDLHFVRVKPDPQQAKTKKVLPILLVHGWPGSFVEFNKIVGLMTKTGKEVDFVFDVVIPSIPGYGFSSAPQKPNFHIGQAAKIFHTLMTERLGFDKFYTQGGDWGSAITASMAVMFPDSILGHHTNMAWVSGSLSGFVKTWLAPSFYQTEEEQKSLMPFTFHHLIRETGYMHLQATRPDSVGVALNTSPLGLAAYIVEKFATFDNGENVGFPDGKLGEHFTLDELIDNVMIYWWTGTITSSMRFYKENTKAVNLPIIHALSNLPITVPVGLHPGEKEMFNQPKSALEARYRNMVTHSLLPGLGHFAAYQAPEIFYRSIVDFIAKVENSNMNSSDSKKSEL